MSVEVTVRRGLIRLSTLLRIILKINSNKAFTLPKIQKGTHGIHMEPKPKRNPTGEKNRICSIDVLLIFDVVMMHY